MSCYRVAHPKPILVNTLAFEKLARAIVEAKGNAIRQGARASGRKIRDENGVNQAADILESHARDWNGKAIF